MTVTDTTDLARSLMALDHAKFRQEVNEDLRPPDRTAATHQSLEQIKDTVSKWQARHEALRGPACVDRWFMVLSQMSKSVDGQLAAKAEDYDAQRAEIRSQLLKDVKDTKAGDRERALQRQLQILRSEYSRSRANTLRFKSGLDEALIEARALRDGVRDRLYDSVVAEERNRYAARVTALETAVREHQDAFTTNDIEPEPHDLHLWDAVSRKDF